VPEEEVWWIGCCFAVFGALGSFWRTIDHRVGWASGQRFVCDLRTEMGFIINKVLPDKDCYHRSSMSIHNEIKTLIKKSLEEVDITELMENEKRMMEKCWRIL
jgi:hypothetical protein